MNEEQIRSLRNAKTAISLVKSGVAAIVMVYVLIGAPILPAMRQSGDETLMSFAGFFSVLLCVFLGICIIDFIRNLILLILFYTGNDESEFGRKYVNLMGVIQQCAGQIFQIIFGIAFLSFSVFAITKGPSMLAEGSDLNTLYIVSGVFVLAGVIIITSGVIGLIRAIRNSTPAE